MIGTSLALRQVEQDIQFAARFDAPVLLTGEPGVGKRLVARRLHEISGGATATFMTLHCSSAPESRDDVWCLDCGSSRIASRGIGSVLKHAPSGGSAVLLEPEEVTRSDQAALANWLERRDSAAAVRLITSSSCGLYERVRAGQFNDALFYRLNVIHIRVPPLRERVEDVPVLLDHFFRIHQMTHGAAVPELSAAALATLTRYEWPGNVHEIRKLADDLVARRVPAVLPQHLPPELIASALQ